MRSIIKGRIAVAGNRLASRAGVVILTIVLGAGTAYPQDGSPDPASTLAQARTLMETGPIAAASFSSLIILFVLAVLIESALAVIFNWRLFLEMFNGRGVKTLVAILVSWVVVVTFDLDQKVFEALLAAYGITGEQTDRTIGIILTTLILAGGSGGVNRILVALGYREKIDNKPRVPKAPKGEAWIAVRFRRDKATGPIEVKLQKLGQRTASSPPELAAIVAPVGFWYRLWSVFFLDRNRFPPTAGESVKPGFEYQIRIDARDAQGKRIPCALDDRTYCFADGAVIDFDITL